MKICLTGASGHLGSAIYQALHDAGHHVTATDMSKRQGFALPVKVANLLNREAVYELVEGAETLIHVGNHPNQFRADAQRVYTENVAMNMHVFQAAMESGAKRVIFASSIQTVATNWRDVDPDRLNIPCLPVPHEWPAQPQNNYGLSKAAGEQQLDFYTRVHGMHAVSLRLTGLWTRKRRESVDEFFGKRKACHLEEFFSHFSNEEAAKLFLALVEREPWEGHRRFFAAYRDPWCSDPIPDLLERFYKDIPWLKPKEEMDCLWEADELKDFCGWEAHFEEKVVAAK